MPLSGITYGRREIEHILASHWANYRYFDDWQALDDWQREILIAAYRIDGYKDAVIAKYGRRKG